MSVLEEPAEAIVQTPKGATGKAAEYLEKLVTDSFKRELDQEENVVRSLPFFATSIGVLITFVGFVRTTLPVFTLNTWPILVYGLLIGLLCALAALLFFLYQAVCRRRFDYPMHETELIGYAAELTTYYRAVAAGMPAVDECDESDSAEVIERAVIDDLRNTMMGQIGKAAQVSRTNNWARLQARARAFLTLMIALGFALVLIVVILSQHALSGGFYGQNSDARVGVAKPGNEKP